MTAFALFVFPYNSTKFLKASLGTILLVSSSACTTTPSSEKQYLPWVQKAQLHTSDNHLPLKWQVEIEEDGLPAQHPPPIRIRTLPDDPSQPWSTNYGKEMGNESSNKEVILDKNEARLAGTRTVPEK